MGQGRRDVWMCVCGRSGGGSGVGMVVGGVRVGKERGGSAWGVSLAWGYKDLVDCCLVTIY